MATTKPTGEPYTLADKRLAFTSWYHVRPGGFGWHNARGEQVSVIDKERPGQATLHLHEAAQGIGLVVHAARRSDPVILAERDYEQGGPSINTILPEGSRYRAWGCTGWGDLRGRGTAALCYYESEDGYHWTRPNCGLVEHQGNRDNNILVVYPSYASWGTVFVDPSADPASRYKSITEHHFELAEYESYRRRYPDQTDAKSNRTDAGICVGVKGAMSPDGLRWTAIDEPLAIIHSDTHIVAYYDTRTGKYVGYFREWIAGELDNAAADAGPSVSWLRAGRRIVGRAETADFRHWPLTEAVLEPSLSMSPNDVLYTNCRTTIPGAADSHLMFPAVWDTATDRTRIVLATSHEGKLWNYAPSGPVLETAEPGQWDGGCVFATPNLLELPDGDFALPYTGYNVPHKYPRKHATRAMGYAIWPKGRLMGIQAADEGTFTTVAVTAPGQRLSINALVERGGHILIEAADLNGTPILGRDFSRAVGLAGDCFRQRVRWQEHDDLGVPPGEPVMLRFKLKFATVYYLDFE